MLTDPNGKVFGTHDSLAKCKKQIRAIEANKHKASNMADILIHGAIGTQVRSKRIVDELKAATGTPTVRINSTGGSSLEAIGIFNALVGHPGGVDILIEGNALSAAGVISQAGRKVRMMENSLLMLHNVKFTGSSEPMDSDELRKAAEVIEKSQEQLIKTIAARTKKSDYEVKNILAKETWMTANEALEAGFVDEVIPVRRGRISILNLSNLPDHISAFVNSFNARSESMALKDLVNALGVKCDESAEDSAIEEAIVNHFTGLTDRITELEKKKSDPPKDDPPKDPPADKTIACPPGMVNMARNYRKQKINSLLKDGKITATVATDLEKVHCADEVLVAAMTQENADVHFESAVALFEKNERVISYGGKSSYQPIPQGSDVPSIADRMAARFKDAN